MEVNKINKSSTQVSNSSISVSSVVKTRWNEVFGIINQNYSSSNGYSNTVNINNTSTKSYSSSLNLSPQKIEYERYKAFNDMELIFQAKNHYKKEDISNPYHYTNTYNPFSDDIEKEFSNTHGKWDGNADEGEGFGYIDKYGYTHVSKNLYTAMIFSKDNIVYEYKGETHGGYAVDSKGNRLFLSNLDDSVVFGNSDFTKSTNNTVGEYETSVVVDSSIYYDYKKSKYDKYLW